MNKANEAAPVSGQAEDVHPLQKSYMFISTKHVDYDNLSAFEAVSMSLALVLAVTVGVVSSLNLA